jgi:hypothetical protein
MRETHEGVRVLWDGPGIYVWGVLQWPHCGWKKADSLFVIEKTVARNRGSVTILTDWNLKPEEEES